MSQTSHGLLNKHANRPIHLFAHTTEILQAIPPEAKFFAKMDAKGESGPTTTRIPNPVNDKLSDALFSVSSHMRDIQSEMERVTEDSLEMDDTELLAPFNSPDPTIALTWSGSRRAREATAGTRRAKPGMLNEDSVTRLQGDAIYRTGTQLNR